MSRDFLTAFRLLLISLIVALLYRAGPLQTVQGGLFRPAGAFFTFQALKIRTSLSLLAENIFSLPSLHRELALSEERILDLQSEIAALKEENYRLHVLENELEFSHSLSEEIQLVEALVVGEEQYPNGRYSFVINKGSLEGIAVGDIVSSRQYLLGIVSEVATRSSVVSYILDEGFKAACFDQDSPQRGEGNCLAEGNALLLSNIEPGASIKIGDVIMTSGKDAFPLGRILGKVSKVRGDLYDLSRTAALETYFRHIPPTVFIEKNL